LWEVRRYTPPVAEFSLKNIKIYSGGTIETSSEGPSVFIVVAGKGEAKCGGDSLALSEGTTVIVATNEEVTITSYSDNLELYEAEVGNNKLEK
jgi:mannose-6-phosphate isomerase